MKLTAFAALTLLGVSPMLGVSSFAAPYKAPTYSSSSYKAPSQAVIKPASANRVVSVSNQSKANTSVLSFTNEQARKGQVPFSVPNARIEIRTNRGVISPDPLGYIVSRQCVFNGQCNGSKVDQAYVQSMQCVPQARNNCGKVNLVDQAFKKYGYNN